jgi:hypothetical protein
MGDALKVFAIFPFAAGLAPAEHAQHQTLVVNAERMMVSAV